MNLEKIVQCNISLADVTSLNGGYDKMLIIGPLPKSPGTATTPDVGSYSSMDDITAAGFTSDDPVYGAAQKAFSQSPKPETVYVAVQKLVSGETESVNTTLDRALDTSGWYCIVPAGLKEGVLQDIADWAESNEKLQICQSTGVSASPVTTAMFRSGVIHATSDTDYINAAYAARFLYYDPGSEMWQYKTLASIDAQDISSTNISSMDKINMSYYVTVGGINTVVGGKTAAGEWIDVIRFRDWLRTRIQEKVFNAQLKASKIPFTDPGITTIYNALVEALEEGVAAGGIAQATTDDDGNEVPSYSITVPKAADIDAATRKTRKLTGIKWSANLAGAISVVRIEGTLSY